MIVSWNGITNAGRVKEINQDSLYYNITPDRNAGVFVVADGVGGLEAGEVASQTAVAEVEAWWREFAVKGNAENTEATINALSGLVFIINQKIQNINLNTDKKSATTFSLLLICKNRYYIAHVGDSRIYAIDKRNADSVKLLYATRDHSKAVLREVNGKKFVQNMLTDGLGYRKSINCDCSYGFINEETRSFLLCSDGVFKRQNEDVITAIIKANNFEPAKVCEDLINNAMRLGESDNITAILVNTEDF